MHHTQARQYKGHQHYPEFKTSPICDLCKLYQNKVWFGDLFSSFSVYRVTDLYVFFFTMKLESDIISAFDTTTKIAQK